MSASFAPLVHRAVLKVEGEDRRAFLQGMISNDIAKAGPDRAIWAALLTAQGKFLYDMFIVESGDAFLIDVEAARLEELRKKLSLYKLRAKVSLAAAPDLAVAAAWGEGACAALGLACEAGAAVAIAGGVAYGDPRLIGAGARLILAAGTVPSGLTAAPVEEWDRMRMGLGLPDGSRDIIVEKGILLENGFDELNGVDFKKGCYMGQELTARTKHRGLIKRRLMPVDIDGPAPEAGTPILLDGIDAGEMRSAAGDRGLAVIRLEQFRTAAGRAGAFTCGEARLTPHRPDWAVFPEAE